ncbi:zinc finger and BTB domain-containing protein 41-like isoform X2 [Xyrichtys novacula]|uniref:Zinc finger and BTB domain-containing protein 41-like isoform X2 n=1 Tax=Xyrichtys novacula TaxID=13765 RepID=A0AAV1HBD2_XYRNO|nr:zinc finger and BTB domain-containing protein 41-like isoform X2 [Xyrichtys novacula]CAJ1082903.1 zinc finger and BTB domain-containing protein 41-like isoform X2 [Xyrichtys novacula]
MSKVQELRVLVNQRLSAAAEEIFELFERTILEYEEKLCGSKENQHKLLDAVYNPEVRLHRADIDHLIKSKEEPLHQQQKRSLSLDQENPLQIKEEQEELWSSQEEEQLGGLVEAGINSQIFTPVPLKGDEEDREEPQSSQLHEHQTEEKRDTETDDSYVWEETSETQTGVDPLRNEEMPQSEDKYDYRKTSAKSFECARKAVRMNQIKICKRVQRPEKSLIFSVCGERSISKSSLSAHMAGHTKGHRFSCSLCKKSFPLRFELVRHMRSHTGDKPFSCSECGKRFTQKSNLQRHQLIHSGDKPYSCSICGKRFTQKSNVYLHRVVHTKEKAFSCLVCLKRFTQLSSLKRHKCKGVALS